MADVHDVAAYILKQTGTITTMKLQKLVYYSQAWSLVWDEAPIFSEKIRAWANGPVVRELYDLHKGKFSVSHWDGSTGKLTQDEKETIDSVLKFYGNKSSQWLIDLTHMEDPWRLARQGLSDGANGNAVITHASMHEYYSSL